ncbi:MAG: UDP-3-O-(3-hydroxymyristoyl)glucosamine N-acyltransferase [Bacteroidota bacterium]
MTVTAKELSKLLNGKLEGDPDVVVYKPAKIEEGESGAVSFIANPKYIHYAYTTDASVLLVSKDLKLDKPIRPTLIRVDDVYSCVSLLLERFGNNKSNGAGVDNRSTVHPEAAVSDSAFIGAFSYVSKGAVIGENTIIHPQVFIGENAVIGNNVILYPGVKVYHDCKVGNHVVIHSNTVVGSDGFGFVPQKDGSYKKVPQIGNVVIEDHVEIGSNCVIDRATMGSTLIKVGVKLDNLIQVAHNVEVGSNTVIAAQVGIAGSTKIGSNCMVGGQAGFVGHIEVADGTRVQAQSGVARSITQPNKAWYGSPAFEYNSFLRSQVMFQKLPDLVKRINELEKMVKDLQNKI